jgi:hypothetical protein
MMVVVLVVDGGAAYGFNRPLQGLEGGNGFSLLLLLLIHLR